VFQSNVAQRSEEALRSDQMFSQIQSGIARMKTDLERECDSIQEKIDQILRTELHAFDKISIEDW